MTIRSTASATCMARLGLLGQVLFLALWIGCTGDPAPVHADGATPDAGATDGVIDLGADVTDALSSACSIETVVGKGAVALHWTPVSGAVSYTLYWSEQPGVSVTDAAAIPGVKPGYIHRGLTNGQTYHYVVGANLDGAKGPFCAEAEATPEGEFELVQVGSGHIPDLTVEGTRQLPLSQRLHAILLSDGYMQSELDSGVFDNDVSIWLKWLFAIDPYDRLAQAFVIWKLPRASKAHASGTDPQAADTAFRVPLTSSATGVGKEMSETAKRVWQVLQGFPYPFSDYYPSGGRTSNIAKAVTIHIMVYNPKTGASGFSGRSVRLGHPTNSKFQLSTAIAHNLPHEFTHAFARLQDEYMETSNGLSGSPNDQTHKAAYVSNVVQQASCATVPWKHLLVGGAYNPDQTDLVGAFGDPKLGFHSEFKCLMNGTHDNAQFYGGNGNLRTGYRLCNFCRELLTFRLHERAGILKDQATALDTWKASFRDGFYKRFGFKVPQVVPQKNSAGEAWYQACTEP